jgi:hypothetical protein
MIDAVEAVHESREEGGPLADVARGPKGLKKKTDKSTSIDSIRIPMEDLDRQVAARFPHDIHQHQEHRISARLGEGKSNQHPVYHFGYPYSGVQAKCCNHSHPYLQLSTHTAPVPQVHCGRR